MDLVRTKREEERETRENQKIWRTLWRHSAFSHARLFRNNRPYFTQRIVLDQKTQKTNRARENELIGKN